MPQPSRSAARRGGWTDSWRIAPEQKTSFPMPPAGARRLLPRATGYRAPLSASSCAPSRRVHCSSVSAPRRRLRRTTRRHRATPPVSRLKQPEQPKPHATRNASVLLLPSAPISSVSVSARSSRRSPSRRGCRRRRALWPRTVRVSRSRRSTSHPAQSGRSQRLFARAPRLSSPTIRSSGSLSCSALERSVSEASRCSRVDLRRSSWASIRSSRSRSCSTSRRRPSRSEGFGYDPVRGELWFVGETAEAVLARAARAPKLRSSSKPPSSTRRSRTRRVRSKKPLRGRVSPRRRSAGHRGSGRRRSTCRLSGGSSSLRRALQEAISMAQSVAGRLEAPLACPRRRRFDAGRRARRGAAHARCS